MEVLNMKVIGSEWGREEGEFDTSFIGVCPAMQKELFVCKIPTFGYIQYMIEHSIIAQLRYFRRNNR